MGEIKEVFLEVVMMASVEQGVWPISGGLSETFWEAASRRAASDTITDSRYEQSWI